MGFRRGVHAPARGRSSDFEGAQRLRDVRLLQERPRRHEQRERSVRRARRQRRRSLGQGEGGEGRRGSEPGEGGQSRQGASQARRTSGLEHSREAVSRAIEEAAAAAAPRRLVTARAEVPISARRERRRRSSTRSLSKARGGERRSPSHPRRALRRRHRGGHAHPRARGAPRPHDRRVLPRAGRASPSPLPPPFVESPASSRRRREPTVFDTARELLSTDFYLRKWGRMGMRNRSQEVDDFGFDPVYEQKVQPIFDFLYDKYFRVEVDGLEHIPSEGRCLLVANHSGTLPYDGMMIKVAGRRRATTPPSARSRRLAEDFIFHFPFLGLAVQPRIGAVRACQENAERLLRKETLVAVLPEGVKGSWGSSSRSATSSSASGAAASSSFACARGRPSSPWPSARRGGGEGPMIGRIEYLSRRPSASPTSRSRRRSHGSRPLGLRSGADEVEDPLRREARLRLATAPEARGRRRSSSGGSPSRCGGRSSRCSIWPSGERRSIVFG